MGMGGESYTNCLKGVEKWLSKQLEAFTELRGLAERKDGERQNAGCCDESWRRVFVEKQ